MEGLIFGILRYFLKAYIAMLYLNYPRSGDCVFSPSFCPHRDFAQRRNPKEAP